MNTTGQICNQSGIYRCKEHPTYSISLSKGEKFPPCHPKGGIAHSATWLLVMIA